MIDDENFDWASLRFECEAKLFVQILKKRGSRFGQAALVWRRRGIKVLG